MDEEKEDEEKEDEEKEGSFQKRLYHPSVKSALYYPYLLST